MDDAAVDDHAAVAFRSPGIHHIPGARGADDHLFIRFVCEDFVIECAVETGEPLGRVDGVVLGVRRHVEAEGQQLRPFLGVIDRVSDCAGMNRQRPHRRGGDQEHGHRKQGGLHPLC